MLISLQSCLLSRDHPVGSVLHVETHMVPSWQSCQCPKSAIRWTASQGRDAGARSSSPCLGPGFTIFKLWWFYCSQETIFNSSNRPFETSKSLKASAWRKTSWPLWYVIGCTIPCHDKPWFLLKNQRRLNRRVSGSQLHLYPELSTTAVAGDKAKLALNIPAIHGSSLLISKQTRMGKQDLHHIISLTIWKNHANLLFPLSKIPNLWKFSNQNSHVLRFPGGHGSATTSSAPRGKSSREMPSQTRGRHWAEHFWIFPWQACEKKSFETNQKETIESIKRNRKCLIWSDANFWGKKKVVLPLDEALPLPRPGADPMTWDAPLRRTQLKLLED